MKSIVECTYCGGIRRIYLYKSTIPACPCGETRNFKVVELVDYYPTVELPTPDYEDQYD
jgi:hypothetical protein